MLDFRSLDLLDIINRECLNTGYKVIEKKELLLAMPESYGIDLEGLNNSLSTLCERGYISVKYEDENEVCLCPLPEGRLIFEKRVDGEIKEVAEKKSYFIYSFFGGLLGGAASSVIIFLILFFAGRL